MTMKPSPDMSISFRTIPEIGQLLQIGDSEIEIIQANHQKIPTHENSPSGESTKIGL